MRIAHLVFAFAAAFGAAAVSAAPARADLLITVDKSLQLMTVDVDGSTRYVWPVSTGAPGYDTPSGQFKPFRMEADHFSKEWDDAPMPHSIFFTMKGHAIHGSMHTKALGTPASHGCVRLLPKNAAILFDLVKQQKMANTRVVLTGETPTRSGVPVARRNNNTDQRAYSANDQRTYTSNDQRAYSGNDQRGYSGEVTRRVYANRGYDQDITASVPQRRGRIVRDQYGRQYIVYDDEARPLYGRDSAYAAPGRYDDGRGFGWPFGR